MVVRYKEDRKLSCNSYMGASDEGIQSNPLRSADIALCDRFPHVAIQKPYNMCPCCQISCTVWPSSFFFPGPGWRLATGKVHGLKKKTDNLEKASRIIIGNQEFCHAIHCSTTNVTILEVSKEAMQNCKDDIDT